MQTSMIDLSTPDGPMPLYQAAPDDAGTAGATAAVIVIQEAFGVNPHIEDVTRRFAAEGYQAVAPHLFHRSGGGSMSYGDFAAVMPHMQALRDDDIIADLRATLAHLEAAGVEASRTAIVGFCMGGRVSFLAASSLSLGAAVGFYGGGIVEARMPTAPALVDGIPSMKTAWLGLFGDLDAHISIDHVEQLRAALQDAPVDHDIVRYADADHGFHCDARESYNAKAAADGWQRTLAWIAPRVGR
jgi:carboxymethylenebutenolidase